MNPVHLEDRIRWGLNVAARATGIWADAYRPHQPAYPLAPANRFLRLPVTFTALDGHFRRPNSYGNALWQGIFDAVYTRPGDYLVRSDGTWFIAAQPSLFPVLCVRTNRTVSFSRPAAQSSTGVNSYGGVTAANMTPLLTNWPASVLAASREGRTLANLPSDTSVSYWSVLLPPCGDVVLRTADLMCDDLGRNGVVATTELSELGWRLIVRQAAP